jgi:hypothetical protein
MYGEGNGEKSPGLVAEMQVTYAVSRRNRVYHEKLVIAQLIKKLSASYPKVLCRVHKSPPLECVRSTTQHINCVHLATCFGFWKAIIRQIYTNNLFLNYCIAFCIDIYVTVLQLLLMHQIFSISSKLKPQLLLYIHSTRIKNFMLIDVYNCIKFKWYNNALQRFKIVKYT